MNHLKDKAYSYARAIDLEQFNDNELCELSHRLNTNEWDDRLGKKHKEYDGKNGCVYTIAIMNRIADKVGDKAVNKWYWLNILKRTEQEFEDWFDQQVAKAALRNRSLVEELY